MDKKISIIVLIVGIVLIAGSLAFVPKETMESYGIFIIIGAFIAFIILIAILVFLNNKSSGSASVTHTPHPGHEPTSQKNGAEKKKQLVTEKIDILDKVDSNKNNEVVTDKTKKGSAPPPKGSPRARHSRNSSQAVTSAPKSVEQKNAPPKAKKGFFGFGAKKADKKPVPVFVPVQANNNGEKSVKEYENERRIVENQLKGAETKYLKHKINQDTYDSVTQESHQKLIEIEAEMDMLKQKDLSVVKGRKMQYVSNDKQAVLDKLFKEKSSKVYQIRLAEKKYLKRQIDAKTYQKIKSDVDKEIISIDSKIKALHKADEIDKIKLEMKASLAEVEKQQNISSKRIGEQLEEDILEQLPWGR